MEHDIRPLRATKRHGAAAVLAAAARPGAAHGAEGFAGILIEVFARVAAALALGIFAYAAYMQWRLDPSRITLILLAVSTTLTVGLSLFAEPPKQRDWSPVALFFSLGGTFYYLVFQLSASHQLIPETIGAAIQLFGLFWQLFAKASLRKSFGILPANRGVVSRGAYRFVRHPMYLGYLIIDTGFLLTNFSVRNLIAVALQIGLQVGRIHREERVLSEDAAYRAYRRSVRYRVIPGIF
ncbi:MULTISPECIES: methyltransferase family protein [Burkholderia]|uniref:methyltransferase family protein n=1 Tax=Burkholderia TaxID=32008 RepID=UPI0007592BB6|nr:MULTISPECIES: isoprenylcysteine carboxylmethyltransferase family protein [Burkholderia]AOJ71617.1 isoprenylcysteine carboxyl methyltransferase [Burkholderia savannae]AOK50075.1 isoprenylcysteine carboxyl methyltransferase [Burkholderia sp. MSMB617WGS]KVG47642.1 isoprenylcysteine carboxyl methyltransferase [Burkholderia sp. MSMB0265]KVG80528.1 isoprenylcysteine carboxyl methyltransferase [Burkholderia sp. MSMB2040]KVG93950.1 isoprenylcysteine carboxyl methyltransferase [Burkholderia sp. MSMB